MSPRELSDLPEEILLYIIEEACEGERCNEIHNLLLVNRQISRLALPLLYRNVGDPNSTADATQKLILKLLFDRRKAELVHSFTTSLEIELDESPRVTNEKDDSTLEKHGFTVEQHAEIRRVVNVLKEYDGSEGGQKRWGKDFLDGPKMSVILPLMLARLPNLHELTHNNMYDEDWQIFESVIDAVTAASKDAETGVKSPFAKLEKVNIGDWGGSKYPNSPFPLTVVAKWPSVKVIESSQVGDGDRSQDGEQAFLDLNLDLQITHPSPSGPRVSCLASTLSVS
ncbi:hypothetical protein P171DRAFT_203029 [Karstenula rhodostoma CBS 690.94]|uniref:F-box domain-containing protein n=1 Tax=Karstenula rhodostoma CBS 690.94 TaxID=1392251 RepID=A0A9P4PTF7_9PLEO|nr:hypothetical protein P171DRAFT_203029 [Karstenula rhodostoma CBS 690.94]